MASVCAQEHIAADVTDLDGLGRVMARAAEVEPVLVVTEGLLVYLTSEQVSAIARTLHVGGQWWLTDIATPRLLRMLSKSWQPHLLAANAPMQFAPENSAAFFDPLGWREAEFRSIWTESLRLKRTVPLAWLWSRLSRLSRQDVRESYQRMSGVLLLQRT